MEVFIRVVIMIMVMVTIYESAKTKVKDGFEVFEINMCIHKRSFYVSLCLLL